MDQPASEASAKPLEFRGKGGEFFAIWIVNLMLSIVTLGIYIPWARVRTRRYFHRNTFLAGHGFDYIADPKRLLIGYLIIGAFFIIYMTSSVINPLLVLPVLLVFWGVLPWLRYKSARFFASNSTYRNLRFRFKGTLGEAYTAYLGFPLLAIVTAGLLGPLASFREKQYFFGNFAFGSFGSTFNGRQGWFFKAIYSLAAVGILLVFVMVVLVGVAVAATNPSGGEAGGEYEPPGWIVIAPLLVYGSMFVLFGVWMVISKNYCWNHLVVNAGGPGEISFQSRLKPGRFLWIFFSNLVLTVVTLGLFAPFAAVRMYRYRVESLSIFGEDALDQAVAVASAEPNAMGDSAADLFDFELGL